MRNFKETIRPIVQYFRELSVIVAGIAITVSIGLWVNNHNTRKDQKQYLDAIKVELEYNIREFDMYERWLQKSVMYAEYITSNDKKSLNSDTLEYYTYTNNDGCGIGFSESVAARFPTNAFEMFKISGAMRQINDKELLQSIWNTYAQIEAAKSNIDRLFQIKSEEAMKMVQLLTEDKTIDVPMQSFHSCGLPYEMVRHCRQTSEDIKRTLSKLEESKIIKH